MDIGNPKYNIGSGTKLLFTSLSLKVFRHEEREREGERERERERERDTHTHNLSMLTAFTSSALNPTNARRPKRTKSSGLAQL